jgi:adenine C2-methylase RlmN of 23S rRNA A2503 and tRNA A37
MNRPIVKEALRESSGKGLVISFAAGGDWAFNRKNSMVAIYQLDKILKPGVFVILPSIGIIEALEEYIQRGTGKKQIRHDWSLPYLDQNVWDKKMLGAAGQDILTRRELYQIIARKTGQKVTIARMVRKGENDSKSDAQALAAFILGREEWFCIKLMAYSAPRHAGATSDEEVNLFRTMLIESGVSPDNIRIKRNFGVEIKAGCGCTLVDLPKKVGLIPR